MNPLAALLLKVTLVLLAALLSAALLRNRAAALRHLLWTVTLSGVVLLTLTAPFAPLLPVRIAAWRAAPVPVSPSVERRAPGDPSLAGSGLPNPGPAAPGSVRDHGAPAGAALGQLLFVLWASGAGGVGLWYLLGHVGLARIARRATPLHGSDWDRMGQIEALGSGVKPPRILRSKSVGSPVIWGMRRPVVLLPASADEWPSERRRVVLAHELAHAARGDIIAQFIATVVCALYWFHPLAWLAARRLRMESERACDDQVVSRGIPVTDYAGHLLDVARGSQELRPGGLVAIGMAKPSQFEGRLLALLDERRPRSTPPARTRATVWAAVATLILPLAALSPVPSRAAAAPPLPRAQESDTTFVREIEAAPGERLMLNLETGGTVRVEGWDEPRVRVRVRLGGPDWRESRVTLERSEGGVRLRVAQIREQRSVSTSHEFELQVPRRFDVRVNSAGGAMTLVGLEGNFSGESGGGNLTLERVRGHAELSTGGGNVTVTDAELSGSVGTGGGEVNFSRVKGPLEGSTGGGSVITRESRPEEARASNELSFRRNRAQSEREHAEEARRLEARIEALTKATARNQVDEQVQEEMAKLKARLAELGAAGEVYTFKGRAEEARTSEGRVNLEERRAEEKRNRQEAEGGEALGIEKAGGDIVLESAPDGARLHTGGGVIRVGRARGKVVASTGGGDISIGPVAGSVNAQTGAGDVEITLIDAEGREQSVEVGSGHGSLQLILPRNYSGRFDLETAYTQNHARRTRIESDWELQREETTQWDDRMGSPRKYVRARGEAGNGGGWIRVRVVNGDITVRKGDR